jgi:hypothetical protein
MIKPTNSVCLGLKKQTLSHHMHNSGFKFTFTFSANETKLKARDLLPGPTPHWLLIPVLVIWFVIVILVEYSFVVIYRDRSLPRVGPL